MLNEFTTAEFFDAMKKIYVLLEDECSKKIYLERIINNVLNKGILDIDSYLTPFLQKTVKNLDDKLYAIEDKRVIVLYYMEQVLQVKLY